ncbi:cyclase family protein [Rhodococcus pseudokoreensis]|uniref:Cyclase family protein n=1 Tax=Rhodococcus pseudokoreensis TaxID=2811421 RepID=A0A974W326_9NOCA|nr:cyclase family protein [Rhodococcus pseudokoreensis]QSE89807.1 cyclase family protein [Rhodococcus pseudokoreensis]
MTEPLTQPAPLRHLGPTTTLRALSLVRTGEIVPLNRSLDEPPLVDPPVGRPPLQHIARMHNNVRPRSDGSHVVVNDDVITVAMQGTSHWDALAHWGAIEPTDDHVFFGGRTMTETHPEFGAKTLGIDLIAGGVVTRGLVLDMVAFLAGDDADYLPDGRDVTRRDVEAYLAHHQLTPEPGDAVVLFTGFEARQRSGAFLREAGQAIAPGFTLDTLDLWADTEVFALVSDNPSVEPIPMPEGRFHTVALKHLGIHLGELWALEELVRRARDAGRYEFALISVPLNVRGAFGSPANAIAVL